MNATPPPGWYPDNVGDGLRYWNGHQWTEHTAPLSGTPSFGSPAPHNAAASRAEAAPSQPNWLLRHKVLTGVATFVVLLVALGALGSAAEEPAPVSGDTSAETDVDSGADADAVSDPDPEPEAEPVDTDGDGVVDEEDFAPKDRKVQTRDDVDSDKDGTPDYKDDFPKNAKYTKDTDGDSVPNQLDDFPKDDRYHKDSDGDGVADSEDAFPGDPSRSEVTLAMENALGAAQDYLDFSAFSRQGLIDQLTSDYGSGFRLEEATWAVDNVGANWKEQAVRSAKEYLDFSSFSRQGLIDQLSSSYGSKFTVEEATYAVNKIGL